jgi:catechol 2,3-dioxygenase-like lactoylglutathione lyase family enzyme
VFDHVAIRVSDRLASERFYGTVLASLGIDAGRAGERWVAWDDFLIVSADSESPPTRNLHLAFVAPSHDRVDEFWRAGTSAGYEDAGEPGERPQYTSGYYGAFLRDPDGNSVEAVHHDDVRRGGNIDHLWIGVRDLDAATSFYSTLAPHLGLREGRRREAGRQFRGPWATFSLVADGRPPTEGLQMAFAAHDRQTVEDFHRAAVAAGHDDLGLPKEGRLGDYAAGAADPDGTTVESVFRNLYPRAAG